MDLLIRRFLAKANEHERTLDQVKSQIREILYAETGALWTIWKGGTLTGYFYADIVPTEYEGWICLIHQLMIDPKSPNTILKVENELEEFMSKRRVTEMAFFTRRNTEAFIRRLKKGWHVDSIVLKRNIK